MSWGLFRRKGQDTPLAAGHVLDLYEGPLPADRVAAYLRAALEQGGSGLAFATAANTFRIRQGLGPLARRRIFVDAEKALASFMANGRPDPGRFHDVVKPLLAQARRQGGPVRAYGEMVAVLVSRGEVQAAVELERLWSLLLHGQQVGLLCAYPLASFAHLGAAMQSAVRAEHVHA